MDFSNNNIKKARQDLSSSKKKGYIQNPCKRFQGIYRTCCICRGHNVINGIRGNQRNYQNST